MGLNHGTGLGNNAMLGSTGASPSGLLQVSELPGGVDDKSLLTLFSRFGNVRNIQRQPGSNVALIEYFKAEDCSNLVNQGRSMPFFVGTSRVKLDYGQVPSSPARGVIKSAGANGNMLSIEEQMQMGGIQKVLHFTIANAAYPINIDVMKTICSSAGSKIVRMFIGKKKPDNTIEALVEFDSVPDASNAMDNLNGADIYSGCCTLSISYASVPRVQVFKNDTESWDFTTDTPGLSQANMGNHGGLLGPQPKRALLDGGGVSGGVLGNDNNGAGMNSLMSMKMGGNRGALGGVGGGRMVNKLPERLLVEGSGDAGYAPFTTGDGVVLMVYNMNAERTNCLNLFNVFCLYGNVARIKFLKSRDGCAMIQMGNQDSAEMALKHLEGVTLFGSQIEITRSKQTEVQTHPKPMSLPDGSPIVQDFIADPNNRFRNAEVAARARILPPFATLHFFNAPPNTTETDIRAVYESANENAGGDRFCPQPSKIVVFNVKPGQKTAIGLLEFASVDEAIDALAMSNHSEMRMPGKTHPYHLKLAFSTKPIDEKDNTGGAGLPFGAGGRKRKMEAPVAVPVKEDDELKEEIEEVNTPPTE